MQLKNMKRPNRKKVIEILESARGESADLPNSKSPTKDNGEWTDGLEKEFIELTAKYVLGTISYEEEEKLCVLIKMRREGVNNIEDCID